MRKITLLNLLEKNNNIRSAMIKHIINQHFQNLSNDKPIAFVEVLGYLQEEGFLLNFNKLHLEKMRDTELFQQYLNQQLEQDKNSFDEKPDKVIANTSAFFSESKSTNDWQDKFVTKYDLIDDALHPRLQKFIRDTKLENTEKFYRTLCRLYHIPPFTLPPFPHMEDDDLRALSGEIRLITPLLKEDCFNSMVGAALSGSKKTMEFIMQFIKDHDIGFDTKTECDGQTILHHAAKSGCLETIQYAVEVLKIPVDYLVRGFVAWSGSVDALKYILQIPVAKTHYDDEEEFDLLILAAMGGSKKTMQWLFEKLNYKPTQDEDGVNILHFAAWSGSVEAMQYAIEKIGISPSSLDKEGRSILHYAAISRLPEALRYALTLNEKHHLNFTLDVKANCYAYDSWINGNFILSKEIKEILSRQSSKEFKHLS